MDLQHLALKVARSHLKSYQKSGLLSSLPKTFLMELLRPSEMMMHQQQPIICLARFENLKVIKTNLELTYTILKSQGKLDSLEEYLSDWFAIGKSKLAFILSRDLHVNLIRNLGAKHEIDLSECFIDHNSDLGKRIMAFLDVYQLEYQRQWCGSSMCVYARGNKINIQTPFMSAEGYIRQIVIWKKNGKVRGLQITTSNGEVKATEKFCQQDGSGNDGSSTWQTIQIPKGQWIANVKVDECQRRCSFYDEMGTSFHLFNVHIASKCNAQTQTATFNHFNGLDFILSDQDGTKDDCVHQAGNAPTATMMQLSKIQAQTKEDEEEIVFLSGLKLTFEYYHPDDEYVSKHIGLPKVCEHGVLWDESTP